MIVITSEKQIRLRIRKISHGVPILHTNMNKILSVLTKAGAAGLIGYEIGQNTQETQVIRVETPDPQPVNNFNTEEQSDIRKILYIILLILCILLIFVFSRFLRFKNSSPPRTIELQQRNQSNQ